MPWTDPPYDTIDRKKTGFSDKLSANMSWLLTSFWVQLKAAVAAFTFNSTNDSSSTSITIGTGNFTAVVSSGKSFMPGMFLIFADSAAPAVNGMLVQVISYAGTSLQFTEKSLWGSGTKTAWTISQSTPGAVSGNAAAGLGRNDFTGPQNVARATVASAASPDIWSAAGNQIDYTGTATATGFATAPQAGASRKLICAGACSFTAGANLLIEGLPSGASITLAANDEVTVEAITTTQFKMSFKKYDGTPVQERVAIIGSYKTLLVANNGATPNSKLDITATELVLKDATGAARLLSAVAVTADIAAAAGANALDTGTEAASTNYYAWVIYNPATNTIASLLSTSSTAPTLPSGYTFKALVSAVYNNAGSNFVTMRQQQDKVFINEASTSGTSIDFFAIPATATEIKGQLVGMSTNGTSNVQAQIGPSGGPETTGYLGACGHVTASPGSTNFTAGFGLLDSVAAADTHHGQVTFSLANLATNVWSYQSIVGDSGARTTPGAGSKALAGTLNRVRFTTANGTDTFDAGNIVLSYNFSQP